MNNPKPFDCVQLKWQIQEQLANEFAGVSEEEAQRRLNERVMADPILGPFLKRVQDISRARKIEFEQQTINLSLPVPSVMIF